MGENSAPTYAEALDDFVVRVSAASYDIVDKRVRLLLKPKPRWMPTRLWHAGIRRILSIEERPNEKSSENAIRLRRQIMDGLTEEQWAEPEFMHAMAQAFDALAER